MNLTIINNYIIIKNGILKAFDFDENFIKDNNKLFKQFLNVYDTLYNNDYCVWGAYQAHKYDKEIKQKIVDVLEKMYNLGVQIENGFTDEIYNNFKDIKDYILNYGN